MNLLRTLLILLPCAGAALAQGGLYGGGIPENVAFVRFIHAEKTGAIDFAIAGVPFVTLEPNTASAYYTLAEGEHVVVALERELTLTATPGAFYTVVAAGGELTLFEDAVLGDPARVLLALYNLSGASIDLMTAGGETEVLMDVAPLTSGSVEVNPADVILAVYQAGEVYAELAGLTLERGEAYSIIVFEREVGHVKAEVVLE
jgi:hypothetical protein